MAVIVISKRVFAMKHKEKLIPLLKKLRNHAKKQKGFISRKTYSSLNPPGEYIIISKWKSTADWEKWMGKKKVQKLQIDIDSLVGEKIVYDIYQPEKF